MLRTTLPAAAVWFSVCVFVGGAFGGGEGQITDLSCIEPPQGALLQRDIAQEFRTQLTANDAPAELLHQEF